MKKLKFSKLLIYKTETINLCRVKIKSNKQNINTTLQLNPIERLSLFSCTISMKITRSLFTLHLIERAEI